MSLDKSEIQKIAWLARLAIDKVDIASYCDELTDIFENYADHWRSICQKSDKKRPTNKTYADISSDNYRACHKANYSKNRNIF